MKLLYDFFPIVIFFIAYKFYGIYAATATFLVASTLQISIFWLRYRRFEKNHVITFVLGFLFGGATLLLHNELFIKWKPTVIYWVLGVALLANQWFGTKPWLQSMIENNVHLPDQIWSRLNLMWALFFLVMGFINLYVLYHFDTNTWVNFKLFGLLGLTIVFIIGQSIYLGRYIKAEESERNE